MRRLQARQTESALNPQQAPTGEVAGEVAGEVGVRGWRGGW